MASRTVTVLVDDITGKEIQDGSGRTVRFSVGGVDYEVDLDDKGAKKFDEALSLYIDHARRVGGRASAGRTTRGSANADRAQLKAIRDWAKKNGHKVSERGRISGDIVAAYKSAHAA